MRWHHYRLKGKALRVFCDSDSYLEKVILCNGVWIHKPTLYDHAVFFFLSEKRQKFYQKIVQYTAHLLYSNNSQILTVSSSNYLCTMIYMKMFLSHFRDVCVLCWTLFTLFNQQHYGFEILKSYSSQHLYRYNEVNELAKFTVKNMGEEEKGGKGGTTV